MKKFYIQTNIGKCKYLVSYYDGIKIHNDGSAFYDVAIFKNKKSLGKFISELISSGYTE